MADEIGDDIVENEEEDFNPFGINQDSPDDELTDGSELNNIITNAPVDLSRIEKAKDKVQTKDALFLDLIDIVNRLQQSHGDADPVLSSALADIDSGLRTHVMFIHKDVSGWILSILSTMEKEEQLSQIGKIEMDLKTRWYQLTY